MSEVLKSYNGSFHFHTIFKDLLRYLVKANNFWPFKSCSKYVGAPRRKFGKERVALVVNPKEMYIGRTFIIVKKNIFGLKFRLYTEAQFAALADSSIPELRRSPLANVCLQEWWYFNL